MTDQPPSKDQSPCVRCGDFYHPEDFALADIPYCRDCIERTPDNEARIALFPPKKVMFMRIRYALLIPALIGLVTAVLGSALLFAARPRTEMALLGFLGGGILGFLSTTLIMLPFRFSRIQHMGHDIWKDILVEQFGLLESHKVLDFEAHLALYCTRKPGWTDLKLPMEIGLLLSSRDGFVFLGGHGSTTCLPFKGLMPIPTMEKLVMWPPRSALRLEYQESTMGHSPNQPCFLTFLDQEDFAANKDKAERWGERINSLISGAEASAA